MANTFNASGTTSTTTPGDNMDNTFNASGTTSTTTPVDSSGYFSVSIKKKKPAVLLDNNIEQERWDLIDVLT